MNRSKARPARALLTATRRAYAAGYAARRAVCSFDYYRRGKEAGYKLGYEDGYGQAVTDEYGPALPETTGPPVVQTFTIKLP
jgi:hypothetical protein